MAKRTRKTSGTDVCRAEAIKKRNAGPGNCALLFSFFPTVGREFRVSAICFLELPALMKTGCCLGCLKAGEIYRGKNNNSILKLKIYVSGVSLPSNIFTSVAIHLTLLSGGLKLFLLHSPLSPLLPI